jgi:hypothetical protein
MQECGLPAPLAALCLATLGMTIVLAATSLGCFFRPIIIRQPTGPPDSRLFRPPRSS